MKKWIHYIIMAAMLFSLTKYGYINVYAKETTDTIAYYAYEQLTEQEQIVYQEVYQALSTVKESVQVSTLDTELLNKAFQCVMNDHPEIFYTKGYEVVQYMLKNKVNRLMCKPIYTMSKSTIRQNKKQIAQYVKKCLTDLPENAGEYETIRYFYEYIIENTEYRSDSPNSQNICSVMIDGESVCQGYAKAFQYLCHKVGINATLVTGYANDEGHAWNLVYADGKPYFVDVTWGDASYIMEEDATYSGTVPPITYDYLMVTTDMLCLTHQIENVVEIPQCVNMELNYFVKENLFFINYDVNKLKTIFDNARLQGEQYVTVKCNGQTVYQLMKEHLLQKQEIFQFLPGQSSSVAFAENSLQYTLSFMLE